MGTGVLNSGVPVPPELSTGVETVSPDQWQILCITKVERMNDIQDDSDRLRVQKKTPPVTSRGLTEPLVQVGDSAVTKHSNTEATHKGNLALEFLELTREEYAKAKRNRLYYAKLGRMYGLTNQQIGTALGISETAVRGMISRAGA